MIGQPSGKIYTRAEKVDGFPPKTARHVTFAAMCAAGIGFAVNFSLSKKHPVTSLPGQISSGLSFRAVCKKKLTVHSFQSTGRNTLEIS